jgi:hypothetical protein
MNTSKTPNPNSASGWARIFKVDRRSATVTLPLSLTKIRAVGNGKLADEIEAKEDGFGPTGNGNGWASAVEFVARFQPEDQRWAWEQAQTKGVRWVKRFVENQTNPPDAEKVALSMSKWLAREFPGVDEETIGEALAIVGETCELSDSDRDES